MSNYDLIAFDMDGTLLNSNKEISEDSKEAIIKATNAGKYVVLSTGRCLPELVRIMPEIPTVRYIIAASGALVYDFHEKKVISRNPIDEATVLEMLTILEGEDVMIHIHSDKSYTQKDKASHMADYNMGIYQVAFNKVATKVDDIKAAFLEEHFPAYKFNVYPREVSQREEFKAKFSHLPLTFAYAEIASLECSKKGISKASGLRSLCDYLGIEVSRTIAVGDSDNDLAILKEAGLAIAMGNSTENALALADVVVNDNDHGGCVQAINNYLL